MSGSEAGAKEKGVSENRFKPGWTYPERAYGCLSSEAFLNGHPITGNQHSTMMRPWICPIYGLNA
ncbi:MAG: hypothetical protein ACI9TH_005253 [Kiritimatiellia bacterium]|jgi:hypothetical protein